MRRIAIWLRFPILMFMCIRLVHMWLCAFDTFGIVCGVLPAAFACVHLVVVVVVVNARLRANWRERCRL